jgi:NADH-quinone oxidoreductase subunit C
MPDEAKPADSGGSGTPEPAAPAKPAPAAKPAAAAKAPATMASTPWDSELAREIKSTFAGAILECSTYLGQNFAVIAPDAVVPVLEFLRLDSDYEYLVDLTAVDYPKREKRFELVYTLYSFSRNDRLRLKTAIADGTRAASATSVYPVAAWLEREVYDMFGIEFDGHSGLRRILLPDEWQGFPLRKDYGIVQQDDRWVQENLGIESGQ